MSGEFQKNLWAPWRLEYIAGVDEVGDGCFLCHYRDRPDDDAANAAAAYKRCQDAPKSAGSDLDRNTLTIEPKGTFFAGTWTAGQESIQNLLPVLREALPD